MKSPFKAYSKATHTTSKPRQLVLLYEGAIRFLQQAQEAIEQNMPMVRYEKLCRAGDIIQALKAALDPAAGEQTAIQLADFYTDIDARIRALHAHPDATKCNIIITELRDMRDFWDSVSR